MKIKEDLLHYLWQMKLIDVSNLQTVDGRDIEILSWGYLNHHDGPDFKDGRVVIDGTIWAGHIEMHLRASDWKRHQHDGDPAYQNVVLHVVMEADAPIYLDDGTVIPCLEVQSRIPQKYITKYHDLKYNRSWIPCASMIESASEITKEVAKDRALAGRLSDRVANIEAISTDVQHDLNEVIYRRLAWSFGLKANADAMLQLAKKVPYQLICKHRDQPEVIEALWFGASGLLTNDASDMSHQYVDLLQREFSIYSKKYHIHPMSTTEWKFARLRPPAFPTIRIAQFTKFITKVTHLDELILHASVDDIMKSLDIELDGYWLTHFRFGPGSDPRPKRLGVTTKHIILANAIAPLIYYHGVKYSQEDSKERAIWILGQLPPEQNSITARWESLLFKNKSMADSQALLQLKKHHCDQQKCLSCPIGHKVMTS